MTRQRWWPRFLGRAQRVGVYAGLAVFTVVVFTAAYFASRLMWRLLHRWWGP